jgi:hypothetical protein
MGSGFMLPHCRNHKGNAMTDTILVDSERMRQGIADALSLYVGPGKRFPREMIASATGMEVRTVKAHCLGQTPPSVGALFSYFRVLPVEFAEHVLGLAGLCGVRRVDADADARRCLAEVTQGAAALAEALADGRIDHREKRHLARELREAATAAEQLAADLEEKA